MKTINNIQPTGDVMISPGETLARVLRLGLSLFLPLLLEQFWARRKPLPTR